MRDLLKEPIIVAAIISGIVAIIVAIISLITAIVSSKKAKQATGDVEGLKRDYNTTNQAISKINIYNGIAAENDSEAMSTASSVSTTATSKENVAPPAIAEIKAGEKEVEFGGRTWLVLKTDAERSRALLISKDIVELKAYHNIFEAITWEKCSLRAYLNGVFFYNNFNYYEQPYILETKNVNRKNQWFGTSCGNDTDDRVFLLSLEEVVKYFGDSGKLSNHSKKDGYWLADEYNGSRVAKFVNETSPWWLRSPGNNPNNAAYVNNDGNVNVNGNNVNNTSLGVRPALYLSLKA
ncbi:MAG: DUF6273 domain-containing protein [Oscillospiraceae bacterium]|nr:DUF6273 domain-containing protein [Oscillospiraceae bacterium]